MRCRRALGLLEWTVTSSEPNAVNKAPTLMAKGNSLFPHIAGLTSAILGCALLLVSSATMGLAGFLSVQVLTPLAVFFVILAFGVVWMVTKLLRHLAQLQPDATVCRNGKVA